MSYTKEEMDKAYLMGWDHAIRQMESTNVLADELRNEYQEWLEGLRPKVEQPPRPDVDGRAMMNGYLGSLSVITDRRDDGC